MLHFLCIVPALLLSYLQLCVDATTNILEDYAICKSEGFGRSILLCDVDKALTSKTQQKLISLLENLQQKVKCKCKIGCRRADGNDRYIGVMLVTNSTKITHNNESLFETIQRIYDDTQLSNTQCDNGLLIVYIKDQKQLATYHGNGSYLLLNSEDLIKLHSLVTESTPSDDTFALQYLLPNYDKTRKLIVQRAETWKPIVGLVIALILVLLILALLLTLFLARFCCCCAGRIKDENEKYRIGTSQRSKLMEPIMVATPQTHRIYGARDAIYSAPYSETPIPPSHLSGMKKEISLASRQSSLQTATSSTNHKHRVQPLHAPILYGFSPSGTPTTQSQLNSHKVDDSTQTNGNMLIDEKLNAKQLEFKVQRKSSVHSDSSGINATSPRTTETASIQPSIDHIESDLPFLDPRRKQEVQTRTDFIF